MEIIKVVLQEARLREGTSETVATVLTALAQKFINKNNKFDITLINGISIPVEGGNEIVWSVKDHPDEVVHLTSDGVMYVFDKKQNSKTVIK